MPLLFVIALSPSMRHDRFQVGEFKRTQVNGKERWTYQGLTYSLPADQKKFNADSAKLLEYPFVKSQGGVCPLLLDASTEPEPVDPIVQTIETAALPLTIEAAAKLLPMIYSDEEKASIITHAAERLQNLKARIAASQAPIVADLPAVALTPEPVAGELPVEREEFHMEQSETVEQGDDDDVTAAIDSPAVEMVGQLPSLPAATGEGDEAEAESEKPKKASKKAAKANK